MPTNDLKIADGVRLPLDAITRTFAALGQRGTGKTSAAVVIAEEMLHHGGGFKNNLGRMRSLGIIDYPTPGQVAALPVLFLEAT